MFPDFYRMKLEHPELQLIISTHWATSGYWFEVPPIDLREGEYVYDTLEKVQELEKRVIVKIAECKKDLRPPGLIL